MTDLPKCILPRCGAAPKLKALLNEPRYQCSNEDCPNRFGPYTEDEWRTLNAPGPVSDRMREREDLAREIFIHESSVIDPGWSFKEAEHWLEVRDEWRAKDGVKNG
jgi:hypothetical protein